MSPSRRRRRRASPEWEGRRIIKVAALPGRGLYARHLGHPEGVDGVHRVTVSLAGKSDRNFCAFDSAWLEANMDEIDVVHVLGVPARSSPEEVADAAKMVIDAGRPLIVTGYHLSDPSGVPGNRHAEQLAALLARADAVITLTDGAAREMRERWGVEARVLPHPHAVDFVRMRRERPVFRRGEFVVGTHLAGMRGPVNPVSLVRSLATAVSRISQARLVVHIHDHVLDPGSASYDLATVRRVDEIVTAAGGVVRTHRPFTESQLWDHLFSLDVSVVPGLRGSHSVWPEACHDLGTQAVLPRGSHAAEQRPCLVFDVDDHGAVDATALTDALTAAREQGSVWRAHPAERWKERVRIAESLRGLYERLCGLDRR